jgi:acyl dehydratase
MIQPAKRFFEDVSVGESLPALEFVVTLTSLITYAGATWDFHRYHYDAALAAALGYRGPFMDGQMCGAMLARQLMRWGGPDAFVRKLSYRLREMVFVDDAIVVTGAVKDKVVDNCRCLALCTMTVTNADGASVIRDATAVVELTRRPA